MNAFSHLKPSSDASQGLPKPAVTAMPGSSKLDAESFGLLRSYVETTCGIAMGEEKRYLIESRLAKLMAEYNCPSYKEFYQLAKAGTKAELKLKIVDAMTTKETLWFRDEHPYEALKNHILPELDKTGRPVTIWSAACSTGQEPYSIAMCVHEHAACTLQQNGHRFLNGQLRIKGTDIANTSIMLSKLGRYDQVAMSRGINDSRKNKFFDPQGKVYAVKPDVKKLCEFQQVNLQDDFTRLGKMDIIFIRNVAIYFSKDFKKELFERLAKQLNPNGYLIVGSTESLLGVTDKFRAETIGRSIVYRLNT